MGKDACPSLQLSAIPLAAAVPQLDVNNPDDDDYGQFSENRKRIMVAAVGLLCFLAPFSIAAILPAVPNIAAEFNTTGSVINYTNAAFLVTMSISPCFFAPWSQVRSIFEVELIKRYTAAVPHTSLPLYYFYSPRWGQL
jgi:hypothetical protein